MREINTNLIRETVSALCIEANTRLRPDVLAVLRAAYRKESRRAKKILRAIIDNAFIARRQCMAICQDTGFVSVYAQIGREVKIIGMDLKSAIDKGVAVGYKKGYLRNSIVAPLVREKPRYAPAVVHTQIVKGKCLKLTVLIKGFGCENKFRLRMFNPTVDLKQVKGFIIEVVKQAGSDACPPYVVGIGIGGTADYAAFLAKKALLKKITNYKLQITNYVYKLEQDLLREINKLDIGPMGLGGRTTCLGVNILTYPTHIAGLPVAVNINCHALRSASKIL
jgi:fumarate hydratase subunit alpha